MKRHTRAFIHLVILVVVVQLMGCARIQVQQLAAYDRATNMPGPARPKLFMAGTNLTTAMTPYAVIVATGGAQVEYTTRQIWWKAAELKADVVIIREGGSQYAGNVATGAYLGSGVATAVSVPMYTNTLKGICLRRNPAKIGFQTDQNKMITVITNEALSDSGILEGDSVVSINDVAWSSSEPNPELLGLSPMLEVKMLVIRPGVGRIVKKIKTKSNDADYLSYTDALIWEDPKTSE